MPFAPRYRPVYDIAIKPAVEECGYICKRADDKPYKGNIVKNIILDKYNSEIVIADLTDSNEKFPFDLSNYKVLIYEKNDEFLANQFREDIKSAIKEFRNWGNSSHNPVQDYLKGEYLLSNMEKDISKNITNKMIVYTVMPSGSYIYL